MTFTGPYTIESTSGQSDSAAHPGNTEVNSIKHIFGLLGVSPSLAILSPNMFSEFTASVAALIHAAATRQEPASLEEAAEVAGASWPRAFARIVFPQTTAAIAAALVVSFIFVFGEPGATVLVAPPGESTLPVRVYTLIANAPSSQVAALALMRAGIVLVPLIVFAWFARDREF